MHMTTELKMWAKASDTQSFILSLVLIVFAFYGLFFANVDDIVKGFLMGTVITTVLNYAFQRNIANQAATTAIHKAINNHHGEAS